MLAPHQARHIIPDPDKHREINTREKLTCKRNTSLGIIASSGECAIPSNLITSRN